MTMTPELQQFITREFHSVDTVAKFAGISRGMAYKAVKAGDLKSSKYGRKIKIRTCDALTWAGIDPEELTSAKDKK